MMFSNNRHALADAIEDVYFDLHDTGAAILDGARYARAAICDNHLANPSIANRAAALAATLAEFTVHAGLFLIWVQANAAETAATRTLTAGTR